MSISNGVAANAANFNAAFISRTDDTSSIGILSLENPDSGNAIENVQQAINDKAEANDLQSHINDPSGAHTAQSIDINAISGVSGTTVQGALESIKSQLSTDVADLASHTTSGGHAASSITVNAIAGVDASDVQDALETIKGQVDLKSDSSSLTSHTSNTTNPHSVTAAQVGLGNVDNTSDLNKPISTATQTALNAKADSSALTSHSSSTSNPHSVTAAQVGLGNVDNTSDATKNSATATLTNKTHTDPIIGDALRLTEQASAPSTPASGFKKLYAKTDGKVYTLNSAGTESEVGSGAAGGTGTLNYITNASAETDTTGWDVYADAAGTSPVDGTSGSVTSGFTWTRSTTSPIRGTGSFLLTKPASNCQGQGASFLFTHPGMVEVCDVTFEYKIVSGTYATGDLRVYIVNATTGAVIEPSATQIALVGATTKQRCTFQTVSASTSYRLCFHVASTSASAFSVMFDGPNGIQVGPQNTIAATVVTDWVKYTPTFVGFGTVSTSYVYSRRVGDSLLVQGIFTAGTPTATTASMTLGYGGTNANVSIDTTKNANVSVLGTGSIGATPSTTYFNNLTVLSTTGGTVNFGYQSSTASSMTAANGNGLTGAGAVISFSFSVPILGWGTATISADSFDGRIITASVYGSPSGTVASAFASSTAIIFPSISFDDVGAYNTTTGAYTPVVGGKYRLSGVVSVNASYTLGAYAYVAAYVAGTIQPQRGAMFAQAAGTYKLAVPFSFEIVAQAGQAITIRAACNATTPTLAAGVDDYSFNIERISGPQTIVSGETVACRYITTAGQTIEAAGTGEIVIFGTKDYDTHGFYNSTTGVATIPVSGKWRIKAQIMFANSSWAAGNYADVYIRKASTYHSWLGNFQVSATANVDGRICGEAYLNLLAGDLIDLWCDTNVDKSLYTGSTANFCYVEMTRVGN